MSTESLVEALDRELNGIVKADNTFSKSSVVAGAANSRPVAASEIRVGGHYLIDSAKPPIVSTHPSLYIWRVIGVAGRTVTAVPAYSFPKGNFVDDEFPKVGAFNVMPAQTYTGVELDVAAFYDASDAMKAIEEQAIRANRPRTRL